MKKGFTLVELLVSISIIGVLTAILMMNLVGARERSRDAQKIQDLNSLKNALRMYYNDNNAYPANKTVILGTGFTGYTSGLGDTSFTYTLTNSGDGFLLKIGLDVGAGNEDINSQTACGVGATDKYYAVCAN
jgi:prepilin-type N-terminal cleavage/methylation domain-containing protein